MDNDLKDLIEKAALRGSNYFKGEATLKELPEKLAEFGVFLLERTKMLPMLQNDKLKEELIEIQSKLDDLRKVVFANKIQVK